MKKIFLFCFFAFLILNVHSQDIKRVQKIELPKGRKVKVFMPSVLMHEPYKEKELEKELKGEYGQKTPVSEKKFWNVYSDRDGNKAYIQPDASSGVNCKLRLNQKLRIAEIKNNFALVYTEPEKSISYPAISVDADAEGAWGWVPMDNLLLWSSCPANDFGILNKALIVQNLNKSGNIKTLGKGYKNPEDLRTSEQLQSDVRFFFVMKKKKINGMDMALLAYESSFDGISSKVLYCWVEESSFTPWSQRSCLEYNWNETERQEHLNGQVVKFYANSSLTEAASNGYKFESTKENEDDSYRIRGSKLRMPILDNDSGNDDVYKCTFFATPDGSMSQNEAEELNARMKEQAEATKKNMNSVNMIVVIDGTQSMGEYFKPLHAAITEGCKFVEEGVDFKVGLVIYRDFADKDDVINYVPVCDLKDPKLKDYMATGGTYGIKSAPGDDYPEALYYGLDVALDTIKMGYSKHESNLIVVIGDCGNHEEGSPKAAKAPTKEALLKKIVDNNINLISFQVHNEDKNEYWELFNEQMAYLVLNNADSLFNVNGQVGGFQPSKNNDGYDYKVKEGKQYYVASMRNPELNESMEPTVLSQLIQTSIKQFDLAVGEQIGDIDLAFKARSTSDFEGSDKFSTNFIKNRLGEENYEKLKKSMSICALTGYTPKSNSNADYYKPVIFISINEFQQMMDYFTKVYDAIENSEDRQPYVDAMKQLLRAMVPDMTDEQMNAKGNDEITNMIAGLNASTESQKGKTLTAIGDPAQVSELEFKTILKKFQRKYNFLRRIQEDGYKYTFTSNQDTYYWIPVEDLP